MLALALLVAGASLVVAAGGWVSPPSSNNTHGNLHTFWPRLGLTITTGALALLAEEWPERALWLGAGFVLFAEWVVQTLRLERQAGATITFDKPRTRVSTRSLTLPAGLVALGCVLERSRPLWVSATLPAFILGEGRFVLAGVVTLGLLWAITGIGAGQWGRRSPADGALSLLLLALPGALVVSPVPHLTREHLGYFVAQMLAFWTVYTWARTRDRLIWAGEAIAVLSAGFALVSVLIMERSPSDSVSSVQDYVGESIQNNVAAGALVVLLPISLALFPGVWRHGHLSRKLTFGFCVFAGVLGLSVAQSRGAIVALAVALAVMAFGLVRAPRWLLPGVASALILASLSGVLTSPLSGLVGSGSAADLAVRTEIWSRAGQAIGDYPLTGIGLGAFREVIPALYPYINSDPARVNHAHNLYLQIGSDMGVLGLIGFVTLVLILLARASAHLGQAGSDEETHLRWLRVGCCAGLVGMLVHGTVDAVTWGVRPAFLAWAVLGLLLALGDRRSEATVPAVQR